MSAIAKIFDPPKQPKLPPMPEPTPPPPAPVQIGDTAAGERARVSTRTRQRRATGVRSHILSGLGGSGIGVGRLGTGNIQRVTLLGRSGTST